MEVVSIAACAMFYLEAGRSEVCPALRLVEKYVMRMLFLRLQNLVQETNKI